MNPPDTTVVIRASAGTGKTYQLTNRFLGLIKDGVPPDQIMAVTFTRLAAGEILERLLFRLATAAMNVEECNKLAKAIGDLSFTRERCLNLLQELTASLHRIRVETLDAYFAQLARSFSLEVGLPPNWEIVEEVQDRQLRWEALEETIVDDGKKTISRLLKVLFQGEAKRGISSSLFGTINNLYSVLLETEPNAWSNFPNLTQLDADELRAAIDKLRSAEIPSHKKIQEYTQQNIEAAETADWVGFVSKGPISKILEGSPSYYGKPFSESFLAAANKIISHAQAFIVRQLQHQTEATYELLEVFHKHYSRLKHRNRGIRFEDVTNSLMELPSLAAADEQSFRMDAEISHLLVDEFQDTSLRQWQILQPLAERIAGGEPTLFETAKSSFFCVGDVKQAIYGWRGGRSEIFDALENQLKGIQQRNLNESFRSSPAVIEVVNRVFRNIGTYEKLESVQEVVGQWSEAFPVHKTSLQEMPGFVQLETAPFAESEGERVSAAMQLDATFQYTAQKIRDLNHAAPERTLGVLVRRNASVAQMIYELRKIGVKASEERGGNPLTDSAAVQVILSLLTLADHPDDRIAAFHIATSPLATQFKLDRSLDRHRLLIVSKEIRRDLMQIGYGPVIAKWCEMLKQFSNSRDQRRLQQLVEFAFRFEPVAGIRTSEFLQYVKSERIADPLISNVRVMTVHQSKGLEFDIVVLPELETEIDDYSREVVWDATDPTQPVNRVCVYRNKSLQALLPDEMREMFVAAKNRQAIESLCLLYVALTRAAYALHMIVAPKSKTTRGRSRTFSQLIHHCLAPEKELDEETELFRFGEERWFADLPEKPSESGCQYKLPERLEMQPSRSPVAFEFKSPSSLEGGQVVSGGQLLRMSNRKALARGTVIHGLFEQVEWVDSIPDRSILLGIAEQLCDPKVDPIQEVTEFEKMLQRSETARILDRTYYLQPFEESIIEALPDEFNAKEARLEVHNERSFVVPDSGRMLSGTVDRLVLIFGKQGLLAADIIDFKTDRLEKGEQALAERVAYYLPQIEAYRRAIHSLFRLPMERIAARLLFVDGGTQWAFPQKQLGSPVS